MNNKPLISIIIPCRNEGRYIGKCLDSIIAQDYPNPHPLPPPQVGREGGRGSIEVLVVDGMSEDGTREIVGKYTDMSLRGAVVTKQPQESNGLPRSFQSLAMTLKLLDNPKKITPCALNIGIKNAQGEIIVRMDAHTTYEKNYISKCIKYLKEYNADNVGGIWKIVPRQDTLVGKAITFSLSHPFGVGNAYYRYVSKDLRWVDTVPFFCCKKEVFDKIGLFNENLPRGQDMEFNLRLKRAGLKTLLVPEIISYYYAHSNFKSFCKHNFVNGLWAILPFKFTRIMPVSLRHLVPFIFALSLLSSAILSFFLPFFRGLFLLITGSYSLTNIYFSIKIALRKKNIKYLFIMPIIFLSLHLGYGLGSIVGAIKLLLPVKEI